MQDGAAALTTSVAVQVLDISLGGAMLASSRPVTPGTRGRLRLILSGAPFTVDLQVQRMTPAPTGTGCILGVAFVSLDRANRELLESFVEL